MKFLLDKQQEHIRKLVKMKPHLVAGQLITPLTGYRVWDGIFACDNGAFSKFNEAAYVKMLNRVSSHVDSCLFITLPDRVGDAKSTASMYREWRSTIPPRLRGYVLQDGERDPPYDVGCWFLGGSDSYKLSSMARDLLLEGRNYGVHIHVGRVNTPGRFNHFKTVAHTCDGSGVARFPSMLDRIDHNSFPRYSIWSTK